MKILTVGDGDLSLSTALIRAYPSIDVTATSLLDSKEQLLEVYPKAVVKELEQTAAAVLYGIDATQLHLIFEEDSFDLVIFHHPHLGDYFEKDESIHRQRHYGLLVHYLASASVISSAVHLALCGNQHHSWSVGKAAEKAGLKQTLELPVSKPFHKIFSNFDDSSIHPPAFSRRALRKKTGSRHWLIKYGYTHQRTFLTNAPVDLSGSKHYVYERNSDWKNHFIVKSFDISSTCTLCELNAGSANTLQKHWMAPALPTPIPSNQNCKNVQQHCLDIQDTSCGSKTVSHNIKQSKVQNLSIAHDVTSEYVGKRIRWHLQHIMHFSKRQAQDYISTGKVQLNGQVVLDSSRILKLDDRIEVEKRAEDAVTPSIQIVERWDDHTLLAWKPVGMRCKDTTEALDAVVSRQEGKNYTCVTKLDTGCSGLCLLVAVSPSNPPQDLEHTFIALVHGKVELNGTFEIPVGELRRWKHVQMEDTVVATIQCLVHTEYLSTVSIVLNASIPSVTSVICYYFRKTVGCPIVGDRFATQEYLSLPRFLKNRLKHRLCFMCIAIRSSHNQTMVDIPQKLQATYWKTLMSVGEQDVTK